MTGSAIIGAGMLAFAQIPFASNDGAVRLNYGGFQMVSANGVAHLLLSGGVSGSSQAQGLRLRGRIARAVLGSLEGKTALRSVSLDKDVELVKTVRSATGTRTTQIVCRHADYLAGSEESVVHAAGDVRITDIDAGKHQTLSANGSKCDLTLVSGTSAKGSPLRSATLSGGVAFHAEQAPTKGAEPSIVSGTCDALVYSGSSAAPTLTMTGDVRFKSQSGKNGWNAGPVARVVFGLDSAGRVQTIDIPGTSK